MQAKMREEALTGAAAIVRPGWPAISALAEVLVSQGTQDGDVATEIIAGAWPAPGSIPGVPRMPWAEARLWPSAKTPRRSARR